MRTVYTVLFYISLPFIFIRLLWRSRKLTAYRAHLGERLGFVPYKLEQSIWIHAVSVGESIAIAPLIHQLQGQYPNLPIVVTNMTPTGRARVQALFGDTVKQLYIPYDIPSFLNRMLASIQPKIAIIVETELWPNLLAACQSAKVPVVLMNARLSEKSAQGYQRIASLMRWMLSTLHTVAVQTEAERQRFMQLGLKESQAIVTGSIKFDIQIPDGLVQEAALLRARLGERRPVWIAASTHPSEEEIFLDAHRLVCAAFPQALLILVPRHPNRFKHVIELAEKQHFSVKKHSDKPLDAQSANVYVGDVMGELSVLYAVSDVAVIAGSFVNVGGHNMLEAAILGKPILTGPHVFNFTEISELLIQQHAMRIVQNKNELADMLLALFADPALCASMGKQAIEVVEKNRGALEKQFQLAKGIIDA